MTKHCFLVLLSLLPNLVLAGETTHIENGSHSAYLGEESLDRALHESYEGGSAESEYKRIHEVFVDAISVLRRDYPNEDDVVKRDAHAKSHGCTIAKFKVDNSKLPLRFRDGVFSKNKTYDTIVRFSNNHSNANFHDNTKDLRGMALKLIGVEGDKILPDEKNAMTQDFLMFGAPIFFLKNIKDYMVILDMINHGPMAALKRLVTNPGAAPALFKAMVALPKAQKKVMQYTNPANIPYFSATPYRLGGVDDPTKTAIKFGAKRVQCSNENYVALKVDPSSPDQPNYLRDSLKATLNKQKVCMDFWIQPINFRSKEIVEDPTIEWKFKKYRVAKIEIPIQEFDTDHKNDYCENLSFTPWHSLPEHRPLGRTNRARGVLYNVISMHRHQENEVERIEPLTIDELR